MARLLMGIIRKAHGVYVARKRVPEGLQEAVALLTSSPKNRVAWLQKSLRTKDQKRANILAKVVLMDFDRIIAKAEASLKETPLTASLGDREIERIAAYH